MARTRDTWVARTSAAYSRRNRRRKARRIVRIMTHHDVRSVLLVGSEDARFSWSNVIERAVLGTGARVVASGLGPEITVEGPRVICDGRALPFPENSFDLVVSNAVIEHVGDMSDQQRFVDEHHRVGRMFIVTTPNRWFPVESHRRVLFRHWSARWRSEQGDAFSRLLSRRELQALLPPTASVRGRAWSPTFFAVDHKPRRAAPDAGSRSPERPKARARTGRSRRGGPVG